MCKYVHVHVWLPRKRTVVGQVPPKAANFFFEKKLPWASCVVLLCLSVLPCLSF